MEQTKQIIKTEAPNSFSFRWGKTGDEAKIYFETQKELNEKIEILFLAIKKVEVFRGKPQ